MAKSQAGKFHKQTKRIISIIKTQVAGMWGRMAHPVVSLLKTDVPQVVITVWLWKGRGVVENMWCDDVMNADTCVWLTTGYSCAGWYAVRSWKAAVRERHYRTCTCALFSSLLNHFIFSWECHAEKARKESQINILHIINIIPSQMPGLHRTFSKSQ